MIAIPSNERAIRDEEVFSAFDLKYPGLGSVAEALKAGNQSGAKAALVHYFETRTNVRYYYDYRKRPLTPIDTDANPYLFQSSMGLAGNLKDFCLFAGKKMQEHVFVRPGRERHEWDLGEDWDKLFHFSCIADQERSMGGF